jgi:pimeloyl-ACP methyl ester carboxylesterase
MIRHWCHRPETFDEDLEVWVDNFMAPGNLQGGFNWDIGVNATRLELIRQGPPDLPKIEVPAHFFWGVSDPVIKIIWADRLGDNFSNYTFTRAEEAGHFVQYERPERANQEILRFFSGLERPVHR